MLASFVSPTCKLRELSVSISPTPSLMGQTVAEVLAKL